MNNTTWLDAYSLDIKRIDPFGDGLINQTFRIETEQGDYIGQLLNTRVFPYPERIATNIRTAARFLAKHDPSYLFLSPVLTKKGKEWAQYEQEYWRLVPFVPRSTSYTHVDTPTRAKAAAQGFGGLTRRLDGLDTRSLHETIPQFHDLSFRIQQAHEALREASNIRKAAARPWEMLFDRYQKIGDIFERYKQHADIPQRLLHHDTKISNILFLQGTEEVLAVCDLDTLMPGFILSDLGDMVRTYACSAPEEDTDWAALQIRPDAYSALHKGYLVEMGDVLTPTEREALFWAGPSLLYMQAIRFLTDYWLGDVYYKTQRPDQNLDRAQNQFILLQQLMEYQTYWQGLMRS